MIIRWERGRQASQPEPPPSPAETQSLPMSSDCQRTDGDEPEAEADQATADEVAYLVDGNGDGQVSISELIAAVTSLLDGCS